MKKLVVAVASIGAFALSAAAVHADDKSSCLDAATNGQKLRDAHKLVEAREQFRICAAQGCPSVVQGDCVGWFDAVGKALPTVVITAKSGSGADMVDVKVSLDGQPLQTKLDGQAVPVNPGTHMLHFEGSTTVDQQVVIKEGEQNQSIAIVLGGSTGGGAPGRADSGRHLWRTVGWAVGGAGIVGLGIGTAFGLVASGDKSDAHCNSANLCDAGPLSSARGAAVASDVGFIAGGLLLAGGVGLVLFDPGGHSESGAGARSLRLAPMLTGSTGGVVAGGTW